MPPATRDLWSHVMRVVNFKTTDYLERSLGEFTISSIREALHWNVGRRKKFYSNKH